MIRMSVPLAMVFGLVFLFRAQAAVPAHRVNGPLADHPPAEPQWSPEMVARRAELRRVIAKYYRRPVSARNRSPWEIMHWIIAYGVDTPLLQDRSSADAVTAIGWLCYNHRGHGQQLLFPAGETVGVQHGPGVEGHGGQFLAVLAQSRVRRDYPLRVRGKQFTVADLVDYEKETCQQSAELTFKLIGLVHYLDSDATWKSRDGATWTIPRLIREEIAKPIRGAACGGTHRLMGLSYAVRKRAQRSEPIVGEYRRAATYVKDYQKYAFKLQNRDGSFSTEWFSGRGNRADAARKMQTTGHILEWLVFSLPDSQLQNARVTMAIDFLCQLLDRSGDRDWEIGPLGHALHTLQLYDRRLFGGTTEDHHPSGTHTVAAGQQP
ncbi:MAG: hypothetical protein BMS9Abin04_073 [Planctomycetia bacterium]|nr:MAG: hypothetical protein BMS9Abin04_073 [Planctomycetia bacterium]